MTPAEFESLVDDMARLDVERDPDEQRAILALLGMLAGGQPVTARALAERVSGTTDDAADLLGRLPRLERDHLDRVVGCFGLTLRSTPHTLTLGRNVLHTWCAWDALYLPVALDAGGEVRSTCPVSERPIVLLVTPDGVQRRRPSTTLVSFVPIERTSPERVRGEFCAQVHFLADDAAAQRWTERVPDSFVLTVDDAFELGRRTLLRRYGDALADR